MKERFGFRRERFRCPVSECCSGKGFHVPGFSSAAEVRSSPESNRNPTPHPPTPTHTHPLGPIVRHWLTALTSQGIFTYLFYTYAHTPSKQTLDTHKGEM